jgi:hypothetical protein
MGKKPIFASGMGPSQPSPALTHTSLRVSYLERTSIGISVGAANEQTAKSPDEISIEACVEQEADGSWARNRMHRNSNGASAGSRPSFQILS